MRTAARWLTAIGIAALCLVSPYPLLFPIPLLAALRVKLVFEPKWDIEAELAAILRG